MAEDLALIRDLALVLVTAGLVALVFHKLRLPPVLGYLAAGVLVGPHVPFLPFVQDAENIALLAQLGVLFLLFALGLQFHLGRLRRVGGVALTASVLEVGLMVGAGFLAARLFQWSMLDALFLGAILAISSTTLIVKALESLGRLREPTSEAIFGILLAEDVIAVVMIALLSSIALTGAISVAAIGALVLRIAIFVVATLVLGLVIVPRLVDHVAKTRVEEVLVLLVVGIAFAVSMVAIALELSLALGAFIAGAIVAESKASALVERRIAPLRDVFTAVFFVSTGILVNPADIVAHLPAILVLAVVCIVGNVVAVGLAAFVAGYPPDQALRVGIGMAMIGELSFVIAQLGRDLAVTSAFLFPVAVAVSALTALVTPFLMRRTDTIVQGLARVAPASWKRFAMTYSAWVSRIRPRGGEAYSGGYDFGAVVRALTYGAVLLALAFGARYLTAPLLTAFGGGRLVGVALYAGIVLLAVPILIGVARAVRDLVGALVKVVVPPSQLATRRGQAGAALLRNTLYAFLGVLLLVVALAAGAAFLPPLPLLAAAAVLVVAGAFVLRGTLRRLDANLQDAVDTIFGGEASAISRDHVLTLIRERYPWDMHVESVIVPPASRAESRRIRDLALPQKTGATIVTHERDGLQTVNPPPDLLIQAGDTLRVMGERAQVETALAHLTAEVPAISRHGGQGEAVQIEEFEIEEGSRMNGVTLAGSRIRETTGASVIGVRRDGVPILNPAPVMRLRPGDSVVILGSPAQLDAARALFRVSPA